MALTRFPGRFPCTASIRDAAARRFTNTRNSLPNFVRNSRAAPSQLILTPQVLTEFMKSGRTVLGTVRNPCCEEGCAVFGHTGLLQLARQQGLLIQALAAFSKTSGVTSASNSICRISREDFSRSRAVFTSMAHKGVSENDAGGHVQISVAGKAVEVVGVSGVSDTDIRNAIESVPFQRWLDNMKGSSGILSLGGSGGARCSLNRILIQSVDFFGRRVGFIKFKAEVVDDETGSKLPGIVFARGGAVAILILLECDGDKYAVLTEQARVPVGRTIMELPAGMLDDDAGDFVGTAAREVEEETGIRIVTSDLVDLTALLDESTGRKMFPSPGGSDEEITLFLHRSHVKKEVIDSLQGQETGLRNHGELIKVHVVPYSTLWRISPDSKVLAAIALYEMALRLNLLPAPPNAPDLSHL